MKTLKDISEAMRVAITSAKKLPEINRLMHLAADNQDYKKASEYKAEKEKILSLMPNVNDLEQWKSIIDESITTNKTKI